MSLILGASANTHHYHCHMLSHHTCALAPHGMRWSTTHSRKWLDGPFTTAKSKKFKALKIKEDKTIRCRKCKLSRTFSDFATPWVFSLWDFSALALLLHSTTGPPVESFGPVCVVPAISSRTCAKLCWIAMSKSFWCLSMFSIFCSSFSCIASMRSFKWVLRDRMSLTSGPLRTTKKYHGLKRDHLFETQQEDWSLCELCHFFGKMANNTSAAIQSKDMGGKEQAD